MLASFDCTIRKYSHWDQRSLIRNHRICIGFLDLSGSVVHGKRHLEMSPHLTDHHKYFPTCGDDVYWHDGAMLLQNGSNVALCKPPCASQIKPDCLAKKSWLVTWDVRMKQKITLLWVIPHHDMSNQPRWLYPRCVSVRWGLLLDFVSASPPPAHFFLLFLRLIVSSTATICAQCSLLELKSGYSQLHILTVENLLAFFLTYLLIFFRAFFLAYLLTFFLTNLADIVSDTSSDVLSGTCCLTFFLTFCLTSSGILAGISPGILSDISSDILSDTSSDVLSGTCCLTFFLTFCLTSSGILAGISPGILSDISSDILSDTSSDVLSGTCCLTFFLTFCLTSSGILAGISPGILSDISSDILSDTSSDVLSGTCCLTFFLTFCLTSSGILAGISPGILSDISSDILPGIYSDILSASWGPAENVSSGGSQLRSGREHWQCRIPVEVRQGTPAVGERGWREVRWRKRKWRRKRRWSDIKCNSPHLTGGELKHQFSNLHLTKQSSRSTTSCRVIQLSK